MSDTEIFVETDENNLGRLRAGQPAIAVAPAYPDEPFAAKLTRVGPNVDSDRGVVALRLVAAQLPAFVLPNMTIDVNIEVRRLDDALALPATAVITQGPPAVMAVVDGRVVRQPVTVLGRNPQWVAISGLAADARVLRDTSAAKEGQRVRPAEVETPS
jgi:HlyD family secretion protein